MLDYLITDGRIIDGTGSPSFYADVGIRRDRIVALGRGVRMPARRRIDASEMAVCPGFIDVHSHSDLMMLVEGRCQQKVRQGVTTELVGQDGIAVAPVADNMKESLRRQVAGLLGDPDIHWDWNSVGEYLDRVEREHTSTNVATLVPYGQIRALVIGEEDCRPRAGQIEQMQRELRRALDEGALGISLGLIYPPCIYASTEELAAVLDGLGDAGAFLAVHMRNESDHLLEATDEALEISRRAGIPLHISHLKAAGESNWHKVESLLQKLDGAVEGGQELTFDQYPYPAGSTMFAALFPPWAHSGGTQALLQRLRDRETREEIISDMESSESEWDNSVHTSGWDSIVVTSVGSRRNEPLEGMTVAEIAAERGDCPAEVACDLMLEEDAAISMVMFWGREKEVRQIMSHPLQMVATDGLLGGKPHPRAYGTFPRILGRYVRKQGVFTLEDAVRRMTSFPARRLNLADRGILRRGMRADVVVFDAESVRDRATYAEPRRFPRGINFVLVNGRLVVDEGEHTGRTPGLVLRK